MRLYLNTINYGNCNNSCTSAKLHHRTSVCLATNPFQSQVSVVLFYHLIEKLFMYDCVFKIGSFKNGYTTGTTPPRVDDQHAHQAQVMPQQQHQQQQPRFLYATPPSSLSYGGQPLVTALRLSPPQLVLHTNSFAGNARSSWLS